MSTARKLPSGNWRARVYSHTTEDGVKHYESFTASTKQEAEMLATKWANNKNRKNTPSNKTVAECIEGYITIKTKVSSPATIKGYRTMQRLYYKKLANIQTRRLTNEDVQGMINDLSGNLSESYIKNIYGLLKTSIKFYYPDTYFDVSLPKKEVITDLEEIVLKEAPSNEDIITLYRLASPWLKKCIALGAFCGMRRAEIAALKYKDILRDKNKLFIHMGCVRDEHNKLILKTPKTEDSVRLANIPKEVIDLLGEGDPEEFVIKHSPDTITQSFIRHRNKLNINIRFHDLRHYFASIGNELHIPDVTLASFGGWDPNSPIIKAVYQDKIKDISDGYARKMNNYFSNLINEENTI